ncbi:TYR-PHOSPHATASE-2 domain-containing protein [Mycena kentingensis (nom. inval.)]|nr:TYR-PHOSPHATASE-2 domain-containing protein [Mycena kentingensis (nom. inval.)]
MPSNSRTSRTSSTLTSSAARLQAPAKLNDDERILVALGNMLKPRPISNSYWVTGAVLACEYPYNPTHSFQNQKLRPVLECGVRSFIDLTEDGELSPYAQHLADHARALGIDEDELEYHRVAIPDCHTPTSIDDVYRAMDVLRDNAARGRITAIHCRGGIGRTGLIVGCWLVENGFSGEEALTIISHGWRGVAKRVIYPHSPQTPEQFTYTLAFDEHTTSRRDTYSP